MKDNLRYTEYRFSLETKGLIDWIKLLFIHIIVGPLRLISEITRKVFFLGAKTIRAICLCALVANFSTLLWIILWSTFTVQNSKSFIPVPSLGISLAFLCFLYYKSQTLLDFHYDIVEEPATAAESLALDFDSDTLETVFKGVKTAEIAFDESINLFIKNPEELDVFNISADIYSVAEEDRLVQSIFKSNSFSSDPVEIPNFLNEMSINSQLGSNIEHLINGLDLSPETRLDSSFVLDLN